jgi:hypothetical protein
VSGCGVTAVTSARSVKFTALGLSGTESVFRRAQRSETPYYAFRVALHGSALHYGPRSTQAVLGDSSGVEHSWFRWESSATFLGR